MTRQLVLPAAFPGILTGIVLSLSRALGETAPLILAGAVLGSYSSGGADLVGQLIGPYTALPIVVYRWTTLPQEEFRQLAAAGMIVLLVITFARQRAGHLPSQPLLKELVMADSEPMRRPPHPRPNRSSGSRT